MRGWDAPVECWTTCRVVGCVGQVTERPASGRTGMQGIIWGTIWEEPLLHGQGDAERYPGDTPELREGCADGPLPRCRTSSRRSVSPPPSSVSESERSTSTPPTSPRLPTPTPARTLSDSTRTATLLSSPTLSTPDPALSPTRRPRQRGDTVVSESERVPPTLECPRRYVAPPRRFLAHASQVLWMRRQRVLRRMLRKYRT